jgi:hypothetical protein
MATRHEVICINKSDRTDIHERIKRIGGKNPNGTSWTLSQQEAILAIENKTYEFYVSKGGLIANVTIGISALGNKYLKTEKDSTTIDNLLSLPECI